MRYLSALAFVVCLVASSSAFAQVDGTVITSMGPAQREGVFETPRWQVPLDMPEGTTLNLQADMNTATYENEANHLQIDIFEEYTDPDSGQLIVKKISGGSWDGGPKVGLDGSINPPFEVGVNASAYRGHGLYARIQIFVRMRIGAILFSTP